MFLIKDNLYYDITVFLIAITFGIVIYSKKRSTHFSKTLETVFNLKETYKLILRKQSIADYWIHNYNILKSRKVKHGRIYCGISFYMPVDLDMVKNIMVTGFNHFVDRGMYVNEKDDPLSSNLFHLYGDKWKQLRSKLSPTFTSGKMKMMLSTMTECSAELVKVLESYSKSGEPVNIKHVSECFTMDIIAFCGFGLEANNLKSKEITEFAKYGRLAVDLNLRFFIKTFTQLVVPHKILRFFKFQLYNSEATNFFTETVRQTVNYREKNNINKNDFMDLLIQLKNKGMLLDDNNKNNFKEENSENKLTFHEIVSQCFIFFNAGFETSSSLMTLALFELSTHLDLQERVRNEIKEILAKHDNKLTYEAIKDMTYLDQIVNETLRIYPGVPIVLRVCCKDYKIPGSSATINKGDLVLLPVVGIHHDAEYFPNPEKFDPDRFSPENKASIPQFAWIPFGEGPRFCIGLRFGVLQAKIGLITILQNYDISLNKKTITPIVYSPGSFFISAKGGVWINVTRRK